MYVITARRFLQDVSVPVCLTRKVPITEFDRGMFTARLQEVVKHLPDVKPHDEQNVWVFWAMFGVDDFMSIQIAPEATIYFKAIYVPVLV